MDDQQLLDSPTAPIATSEPAKSAEAGAPEASPGEAKAVELYNKLVDADKRKHSKAFKRMREDQNMVFGRQWKDQTGDDDDRYSANIIQRHVAQTTASLYAKNPIMRCSRKKRLEYQVWDGSKEQLDQATADYQTAVQTGQLPSPESQAIINEVEQVKAGQRVLDNVCMTLELLLAYGMQENRFKSKAKQWVRRAKTCGVGWIRVGYQRQMDQKPESWKLLNDITRYLAHMDKLRADLADGEEPEHDAIAEMFKAMKESLSSEPDVVVTEGMVYSFPRSTAVIPDKGCGDLRGLTDCWRLTEEYCLGVDEVQEIFGVDLTSPGWTFTSYSMDENTNEPVERKTAAPPEGDPDRCLVREIFDRRKGMVYFTVVGCNRWLKKPAKPDVDIDRFFPHFGLTFNEVEHERELFPPSDVSLLKHPQREYNRAREDLRQHRYANRPLWATPAGALEKEDKKSLKDYGAHDVVSLVGLAPGGKVGDLLQRVPVEAIDQNSYTTAPMFEDVLRTVGSQEANLGGTSNATATEAGIADASRSEATASNIDDLDETLADVARASAQILFGNMDVETVKKIVGPGAAWPQVSKQEIYDEITTEIEAGSSGRPNKAQEIANMERMLPLLIQIPGIKPMMLGKESLRRLDDRLNLDDMVEDGLPSITTMNRQTQPGTGDPATDPNQQGEAQGGGAGGGDNAPTQPGSRPGSTAQGPQAGNPAPQQQANRYNGAGARVA